MLDKNSDMGIGVLWFKFPDDTVELSYDELGRVAGRSVNGSANEKTFDYDPWGRLEEVGTPLGECGNQTCILSRRLGAL